MKTEEEAEKIKKLCDEIGKFVIPEKYGEFIRICVEFAAVNTKEEIERLKSVLEEIQNGSEKSLENIHDSPVINLKEIELLKSVLPESFYITNNKLSNKITKDFVNKGQIELAVIKPKKKGEVITYNSIAYDNKNINISGQNEFTAYDRAIHNAVCSLYVAGNDVLTPAMVYRTVNGMSDNEKVSPKSMGAVKNSLDKSRFLRVKINFTEEAKARNINIDNTEIDSYLLPAELVTVKSGGKTVEAYKILKLPVLYEYASYTKQILSVPLGLLDTKEATRNTKDIIPIKEYLVRRIEIMKHVKTMGNRILYSTIFQEAGITITNKKQRNRLRSYITAILNLWKKRDKYIIDFKEYKEGNAFKGIEILY